MSKVKIYEDTFEDEKTKYWLVESEIPIKVFTIDELKKNRFNTFDVNALKKNF